MLRVEIQKLINELSDAESEINMTKGREYAGDEDALANFKQASELLDISPLKVCAVYLYKSLTSLASYARHGHELSDEKIQGRIVDVRLYAAMFLALDRDEAPPF